MDQETTDYPMVQFENDGIEDFQDMMWDGNGESGGGGGGLMGTKLVLPPSRMQMDKSRLMKPPPLPRVPSKQNGDTDKNKALNQMPNVRAGESPTQDLDKVNLFNESQVSLVLFSYIFSLQCQYYIVQFHM